MSNSGCHWVLSSHIARWSYAMAAPAPCSPRSDPVCHCFFCHAAPTSSRMRLRVLAQRDLRTAEQLHADDFQLITPGGSALSKAQYLDRIASGRIAYLVCEPETMDVRMYDDAAVIRYESRLEVRIGGTPDSG